MTARSLLRFLPLSLALLALTTGARECEGPAPDGSCELGGVIYANGDSMPSRDGCNTCTCIDGEPSMCTEAECPVGPACVVDGVSYPDGSSGIPAPDGCNSCTCDGGALACTEIACPPMGGACVVDGVSYPDGATDVPAPDGCNTCHCDDGTVTACTEIGCTPPPGACSVYGESYPAGWVPSPDGCNTCRCSPDGEVSYECTEAVCGPPAIEVCTAWSSPFMTDAFDLSAIRVTGDILEADVAYSGGCAHHYFRLCYDPAFLESNPVQVNLRLEHDGQADPCEAYPMETRSFDLTPLADAYRAGYGVEHDRVLLRLGDGAEYSF